MIDPRRCLALAALLDVLPAPRASVTIPPEDYRASFRVEALADST